jgi:hypothetical protein
MPTDVAVEAMLTMAGGKTRPMLWWAERGHISQSIGPFLRKRMVETERLYQPARSDAGRRQAARAQSIAARVATGKVFFPIGPIWAEKAIDR